MELENFEKAKKLREEIEYSKYQLKVIEDLKKLGSSNTGVLVSIENTLKGSIIYLEEQFKAL